MDALTFLSEHVPLFAGLSEEALGPLAQAASLKKVPAGQAVLFAGMTVEALHIVAVGSASVIVKVPGKGTAVVAELTGGEVFGEASMLERSVAGATIKAGADGAMVLLIPEEPFRRLIAESPEFAARVAALIAARRAPKPAAPTA
jgi:CRP-like cAMP-binding protein